MARRRIIHHSAIHLGQEAQWSLFEDRSNDMAGLGQEDAFLENSIITIAIQWGSRPSGHLLVGPYQRQPDYLTKDLSLYVIPLQSYVGQMRLHIETSTGEEIGRKEIRVARRKLATEEDLAELEHHWTLAKFPLAPRQKQNIFSGMTAARGAGDPHQWLQTLHKEARTLEHQMRSIAYRPRLGLSRQSGIHEVTKLRRPTIDQINRFYHGRRFALAETPIWERDPEAAAFASYHARFVSVMLERILAELSARGPIGTSLRSSLLEIKKNLDRITHQSPNKRRRPRPRQALMHDRRYRDLERASRLTRRSRSLELGNLESLRPSTHQLYEQWCAWAIIQSLAPVSEWSRLRAQLADQPASGVRIPGYEGSEVTLRLQYEMRIVPEGRLALGQAQHRPDFMIQIEDPKHIVILDAKYRQDNQDPRRPPPDAINELHRYRDVYRIVHPESRHKEIWAAVLYPPLGLSEDDVERLPWYETACSDRYRIGGVPLAPSIMRPLRQYWAEIGVTRAQDIIA